MSFRACLYGRSGRRFRRGHGGGGSMSLRIQCNSMSWSTRVMLGHVHFNLGHIPLLRSSSHTLAGRVAKRSAERVDLGRPPATMVSKQLIQTAQAGHSPPKVQSPSPVQHLVPVGTMVTHRPPVRSVRAALPHTAPIGCCDGKPSIWMRMHQAARWQVFAKQPLETLPRQPVSLAPTHQSVSPSATNFPAESSQSSQIVWHRMVVQIPL